MQFLWGMKYRPGCFQFVVVLVPLPLLTAMVQATDISLSCNSPVLKQNDGGK